MPSSQEFVKNIAGKTIQKLRRRGKYLLFDMTEGYTWVVHLGMTGQLVLVSPAERITMHTHLILDLDDNVQLRYIDTRQFGRFYLLPTGELEKIRGLHALGPEPLGEEFTLEFFRKRLASRRGKIKQLLLDQTFIAGIGNIYADEALHRAGINPEKNAVSLTEEEISRLFYSIREVLREGIRYRGTSVRDYVDGRGQKGGFQNCLRVYGRRGEPCPGCGSPVERIRLGGRSTYFCPSCQK